MITVFRGEIGCIYPSVAGTDMGKTLFKAPDGGRLREDFTQSEVQEGQERPCSSM